MRLHLSLTASLAILFGFNLTAQQLGCTNLNAVNFNPQAEIDDGSCTVFSTSLSYDSQLSDDFEIGTGISNEHFAIAYHGPIEIGIKANRRFIEDIVPVNGNEYLANPGYAPTSFNDPTPVIGLGVWDFLFSFNLGDYTFNELKAQVSIDFDPIDNSNQAAPYLLNASFVQISLDQGDGSFTQGSENLGFSYWQFLAFNTALLYDPLSDGVYDIGVQVLNQGDQVLTEVFMRVIVGEPVDGCTDPDACNYYALANVNDNSCVYAQPFRDCDGNCINDFNANQICDEEEVFGCIYASATNFNPLATADSGSCVFDCPTTDCERADFTNTGTVDINDLLIFLSLFGEDCN